MSILDYQRDSLCQEIWDKNNKLKNGVKQFIINQIKLFFSSLDIEDYNEWVLEIFLGSSLATFYYTEYSDLDIKIIIDLNLFHEANTQIDFIDDDSLLDWLVERGRESSFLISDISGTSHPIDAYFYNNNHLPSDSLIKYDSLYSLKSNSWIKKPKKLNLKHSDILQYAREKSQNYINTLDLKFGETYRDSVDLLSLIDYFKIMDVDDLYAIKSEFNKLYKELKEDLGELSDIRNDIKKDRMEAFSKEELETELEKASKSLNFSDSNIRFKYIQKIGYLHILSELDKVYKKKIGYKEIKEISKVLQ